MTRFCDALGIVGLLGAGTFFEELEPEDHETVSLLRGTSCETACRVLFPGAPPVLTEERPADVCEAVCYGRVSSGLLPLSDPAAETRALIIKYGLKIAAICRPREPGADPVVWLKRTIRLPESGREAFFDFRVPDAGALLPLLTAADACGMRPTALSVDPGGSGAADMTLRIDEAGFCGFLGLLHLEYPAFLPVGIYREWP